MLFTIYDNALKSYAKRKFGIISDHDFELYKPLVFIMKGGNVYRMVVSKYFSKISTTHPFSTSYREAFAKSDFDFEIYINERYIYEKQLDIDHVIQELTWMSYHLLVQIRRFLIRDKFLYLSYFKWSNEYKQYIFRKRIKTYMNDDDCIQITDVDLTYDPNREQARDLHIKYTDDSEANIEVRPITDGDSNNQEYKRQPIYISVNQALHIKREPNIDFNLTRMKIQFELKEKNRGDNERIFSHDSKQSRVDQLAEIDQGDNVKTTINTSGELIDVSILKSDRSYTTDVWNNVNEFNTDQTNIIQQYSFSIKNGSEQILYYAHSMWYLNEDLIKVIFTETRNQPWTARKKEKRLKRMFALACISVFEDSSGKRHIEELKNIIGEFISHSLEEPGINGQRQIRDIDRNIIVHYDRLIDKLTCLVYKDTPKDANASTITYAILYRNSLLFQMMLREHIDVYQDTPDFKSFVSLFVIEISNLLSVLNSPFDHGNQNATIRASSN